MKVKLEQKLFALNGEPITEQGQEMTLGKTLAAALLVPEQDKTLKPIEAMDRYELAMTLNKRKEVDLTPEQMSMLRDVVCRAYHPIISGQVCTILK